MDFLEIFTNGKYDREIIFLKILASNSKWFRVYGILTNEKLIMIEGVAKHYIFLDNFCLK